MAIAVVQTSAEGRQAGVTTVTSAFSSNPASGNKLVAYVAMWNSGGVPLGTVTDNFGNTWTQRVAQSSGNARLEIWEAPVTSTGGSFTLTLTSSQASSEMNLIAVEISGAGAFDQQASLSAAGASTSSAIGPTSTLATAESFVATMIASDSGPSAAAWTVPSGYTSVSLQNDSGTVIAYGAARFITSANTAITPTWTHANMGNRVGVVAVFSAPVGNITGAQTLDNLTSSGTLVSVYDAIFDGAVFDSVIFDTGAPTGPVITGNQTLDNLTVSAALAVRDSITGTQTLPDLTTSASLGVRASITGAQTLDTFAQSANIGPGAISITGAQTLDNLTSSVSLGVLVKLSGTQAVDTFTVSAALKAVLSLSGTQTIAAPTLSAPTQVVDQITFAQTVATFALNATVSVNNSRSISAAQAVDTFGLSAASALLVKNSFAQTILAPGLSAFVGRPAFASFSQTIDMPTLDASALTQFWKDVTPPTQSWIDEATTSVVWSDITPPTGSWS